MNKIDFYKQVYEVVAKIPTGKVMSYGQIGAILGSPYYARRVGQAMSFTPNSINIPWHRVIRSSGALADTPFQDVQRKLLTEEGILFTSSGKVKAICFYS